MKKTPEITARLIEFGKSKFGGDFGWKAKFARALGMTLQGLNPYLQGSSIPGNKLQTRLRELGCDIEWLMTGKTSYGKNPGTQSRLAEAPPGYNLPPDLTGKERRQIVRLINELSKLKEGDREKAIKIIKTIFPK
jgi:transcriptional regulator with XRE-family HTH domain